MSSFIACLREHGFVRQSFCLTLYLSGLDHVVQQSCDAALLGWECGNLVCHGHRAAISSLDVTGLRVLSYSFVRTLNTRSEAVEVRRLGNAVIRLDAKMSVVGPYRGSLRDYFHRHDTSALFFASRYSIPNRNTVCGNGSAQASTLTAKRQHIAGSLQVYPQ